MAAFFSNCSGLRYPQVRMTPLAIIPTFGPIEQVTTSLLPPSINPPLDALDLQRTEEDLHGCVVEAPVPATSVWVVDHTAVRSATSRGHLRGVDHEVSRRLPAHGPANDPAREQVHHHSQEQPPFARSNRWLIRSGGGPSGRRRTAGALEKEIFTETGSKRPRFASRNPSGNRKTRNPVRQTPK
jgi:hypothetical protein